MSRLKDFQNWRENAKLTLEELGYSVSFFDSPKSLNCSARIDFKGNTLEATIMVWEYGNVVAEAFSFITKEFISMEEINEDITPLKKVLNVHLENIIKYDDRNIELWQSHLVMFVTLKQGMLIRLHDSNFSMTR